MASARVIGNTGLRRTRGGVSCDAIQVPPAPSPTASVADREKGWLARATANEQKAACLNDQAKQLRTLIDALDNAK